MANASQEKTYHDANTYPPGEKHDVNGWDFVILQGIRQIQSYEALIARIRVSLEHFEKQKANGEPFPGEDKLKEAGLI